jgi:hypothetical protein
VSPSVSTNTVLPPRVASADPPLRYASRKLHNKHYERGDLVTKRTRRPPLPPLCLRNSERGTGCG